MNVIDQRIEQEKGVLQVGEVVFTSCGRQFMVVLDDDGDFGFLDLKRNQTCMMGGYENGYDLFQRLCESHDIVEIVANNRVHLVLSDFLGVDPKEENVE
jgi:hypothetical protein